MPYQFTCYIHMDFTDLLVALLIFYLACRMLRNFCEQATREKVPDNASDQEMLEVVMNRYNSEHHSLLGILRHMKLHLIIEATIFVVVPILANEQ